MQTYLNQALEELKKTSYGRMILNNAQGNNFSISADNIKIVEPGKRAGRCYREINQQGKSEDKITLSTEVFERNKQQPLTTDEDRIKGLAALLAHELTHAKQYNQAPETIPVDNIRQSPSEKRTPTPQERVAGCSEDSILEADCRTASFMVMLMNNPSSNLQNYHRTTEQNSSFMAASDFERLASTSPKLLASSKSLQQKFARDSFGLILQNTTQTYPEFIGMMAAKDGYDSKRLKKEGKLDLDFNSPTSIEALKSVYNPEIYGNLNLFLNTVPGLSPENRKKLTQELSATSQQNSHRPNIAALRGLSAPTPKAVTPTQLSTQNIQKNSSNKTH